MLLLLFAATVRAEEPAPAPQQGEVEPGVYLIPLLVVEPPVEEEPAPPAVLVEPPPAAEDSVPPAADDSASPAAEDSVPPAAEDPVPPIAEDSSAPAAEVAVLPVEQIAVAPTPADAAAPPPGAPPTPGPGLLVKEGDPWAISDLAGHTYTTVQFARLVNDRETLGTLARSEDMSKVAASGVAATGAALILTALFVATTDAGQPDALDYSVDPAIYTTQEEYESARDFQRGQFEKSMDAWEEQKIGSAAFLVGVGGVMLAVAPFMGRDAAARAEHPAKAYSRSRATEWVERYNATHPPEVPSPEAAPPEAGPSESAPEALPAGAPGSPTGSLRPVLGPGMIGFTGTF